MLIYFSTITIVLLTILITLVHFVGRKRKYWKDRNVPYREPCPIFGNFGATLLMRKSFTDTLKDYYYTYRDEKYVGMFQARRPVLIVNDLTILKNVFTKDFQSFSDRIAVMTDTKREPLLRNLSNMSGQEWAAMRQIVTPTFTSAKMKAMYHLIADCGKTLREVIRQRPSENVNIPNLMSRYMTDVLGSCAFGVEPGALENPDSPFLIMSQKMFRVTKSALLKRYCRSFFPKLFQLLNLKTTSLEVETFFTTVITQVLEQRRQSGVVRNDFLQAMLNVQKTSDVEMTDALITSNSFIFMLAGLETSATAASFSLYELALHQDIQNKVRAEIKECLAKHGELNYTAVTSMRFTTQTVLEALRMHPSQPFTTRLCTSPCNLPDTDLSLKLREILFIPIQWIQRDPDHFSEPDKFDPERFNDDINPPGFMAFGHGPRNCPGARFAQLSVVTALAVILSSFRVEPCEKTTPHIRYEPRSVLLKNIGGIWLTFTPL